MASGQRTATLASTMQDEQRSAELRTKELYQEIMKEEKVDVSLAPQYRAYFGNVMTVCLSGLTIYVPVDGRSRKVPSSFAAEIHRRRRAVDALMMKQARAARVTENKESYAGELRIV